MRISPVHSRNIERTGFGLVAAGLLAGVGYACWYLAHDYATLREGYLAGGPFYRDSTWTQDFFTGETKIAGDGYATAGIIVGLLAFGYTIYDWRRAERRPASDFRIGLRRSDLGALVGILLFQTALWVYGNHVVPPAYDEGFSALHAAGPGAFRALSYYMLPNNHVLFNVINGGLFGWADDLVFTGRLISLGAYVMLGALQYGWLRSILRSRLVAFSLVVLLMVLLPVWGFAIQARGYLLLLLFSWVAFVAAWRYIHGSASPRMAWVLAMSCTLAYATVPVFLWIHLAILSWITATWLRRRRIDLRVVATQSVAAVGVLLFYLPAISFSGAGAITGNRYVQSQALSFTAFAKTFLPSLNSYLNYLAIDSAAIMPHALLLALALTICLALTNRTSMHSPRSTHLPGSTHASSPAIQSTARFYLLLLAATVVTILVMRAVPFHRTLLFQLQFTALLIALVPLALESHPTLARLRARLEPETWQWFIAGLYILITGAGVWLTPSKFSLHLYYYDIVPTHREAQDLLTTLPAGATVEFSDEAYYLEYLWGDRASESGGGTYYIARPEESAPAVLTEVVSEQSGYIVYKTTD